MSLRVVLDTGEVDTWSDFGRMETDGELAIYANSDQLLCVYAAGVWRKVVVVDG